MRVSDMARARHFGGLFSPRKTFCAFSRLEHDMWQKGAEAYAETFGLITGQSANALLDGAGCLQTVEMARAVVNREPLAERTATNRVLDIATGSGQVAQVAAARGAGEVVALDFSSEMIRCAQPVADEFPSVVRLQQGDAMALPFEDDSFDSVVIGFGLLHLPRPHDALAEAHRVLKPGGRIAYSVWQAAEESPQPVESTASVVATPDAPVGALPGSGFKILLDALGAHGDPSAQLPSLPSGDSPLPFFHFADREAARAALTTVGFKAASVDFQVIPSMAMLRDENDLFQMFATATARTRAMLEQQPPDKLEAIRAAMAESVAASFKGAFVHGHLRTTGGETSGTEEILHSGKLAHAPHPTADTPWLGGRRPYSVPMPAIVVSAAKE